MQSNIMSSGFFFFVCFVSLKKALSKSHEDISLCNYVHALAFSFHICGIYPPENKLLMYDI